MTALLRPLVPVRDMGMAPMVVADNKQSAKTPVKMDVNRPKNRQTMG